MHQCVLNVCALCACTYAHMCVILHMLNVMLSVCVYVLYVLVNVGLYVCVFVCILCVCVFVCVQETVDAIIGMFLLPKDVQLQKYGLVFPPQSHVGVAMGVVSPAGCQQEQRPRWRTSKHRRGRGWNTP